MRAHDASYPPISGFQRIFSYTTHPPPTLASVSTTPRPTLDIYANTRGDLAYEPDARWSRQFNNKGYKINIHKIRDIEDIDMGNSTLFSRYAMQPNGALEVNGHSVPMVDTGFERASVIDGYEHGRTYVPNSPYHRPIGQIREKLGLEETAEPQRRCGGKRILCWAGIVGAVLLGCIAPRCCH